MKFYIYQIVPKVDGSTSPPCSINLNLPSYDSSLTEEQANTLNFLGKLSI